jgi:uncharacterized protein YdeI (YjbR/CyaY-like superfamily)
MELNKGTKTFYADSQESWRKWLSDNHENEKSVWLIIYKMESNIPSVYYSEAVDEALCFGWVDSLVNKRDNESYYQYFARRNPKSNWSKINKEKVASLMERGLMHKAGLSMVELAKKTNTWTALDDVDNLIVPSDMKQLFDAAPLAFENWEKFSKSTKRGILEWIYNAKQAETRQKRIEETVSLALQNIKANQYNPKGKILNDEN